MKLTASATVFVVSLFLGCQSAPDPSFQITTSPTINALGRGADGEVTAAEIRAANEAAQNSPDAEPIFRETSEH
ncbi:MAG: hypothetical protein ACFCU4_04255 [Puniceicoccaceae bacterium]